MILPWHLICNHHAVEVCVKVRAMTTELKTPSDSSVAERGLTAWFASISDKFRNPLFGVQAAVDILERSTARASFASEEDKQQTNTAIRLIRERVQLLGEYLDEITGYCSRPDPRFTSTLVLDLISPLLARVRDLTKASVDCTLVIEPLDLTVYGDRNALGSALQALLLNAVEFVPHDRRPAVMVEASVDGDWIKMSVHDNGNGVPDDVQTSMFRPFYTTKEAGTGLGLAIAHRIAQLHGGHVQYRPSTILNGACFTLHLPIRVDQSYKPSF